MTRNNNIGLRLDDWNEHNAKALARTHWRASLVPAAAVIPAPVAYIKVVAVKKLVVGRLSLLCITADGGICLAAPYGVNSSMVKCGPFTLRKLECLRQASA